MSRESGYSAINMVICIVWDGNLFRNHVSGRWSPDEFKHWAQVGFDPPILVANGYVWIYSPGPPPRKELSGE